MSLTIASVLLSLIIGVMSLPLTRKKKNQKWYWGRWTKRNSWIIILLLTGGIIAIANEHGNNLEKEKVSAAAAKQHRADSLNYDFHFKALHSELRTVGFTIKDNQLVPLNQFAALWEKMTSRAKDTTFNINIYSKPIADYILKNNHLKFRRSSKLYIQIGFEGDIEKLPTGYSFYSGGRLQVSVPAYNMVRQTDIYLDRTEPNGNPRAFVVEEIYRQINRAVAEHPLTVAKAISSCLD